MVRRLLRWTATGLLFLVVALCLASVLVPPFLDRIYHRGAPTGHFNGVRFFNPDGGDDASPPGGGSRAGFLLRRLTGDDDRAVWPERVAVAQARPPARVAGDRMLVTWVGHATVLVQTAGLNILTDPVWSDRAGPFGFGPRRVAPPGIRFEDLPPIDLVLVSHNHYDHLDLATLKRLWARDRPLIVTSLGNEAVIGGAGIPAVALDWGGGLQRLSACAAAEGCRRSTSPSPATTTGAAAGSPTAIARCGRPSSSGCRPATSSSPAIRGRAICDGRRRRRRSAPCGSR